MSSRVVVTGAAGFIASHLVDALLGSGHEVAALDRRSVHDDAIAAVNLTQALDHDGLRLHRTDLALNDLDHLVAGADTVFHLAGLPGVRASCGARFADFVTANVLATNRLLDACERTAGRRLVLASSWSVYGTAGRPSRECERPGPASPYGVPHRTGRATCQGCRARRNAGGRAVMDRRARGGEPAAWVVPKVGGRAAADPSPRPDR